MVLGRWYCRTHVIIVVYVYQHFFVTETKKKKSNKKQTHVCVLRTFHVFVQVYIGPTYYHYSLFQGCKSGLVKKSETLVNASSTWVYKYMLGVVVCA